MKTTILGLGLLSLLSLMTFCSRAEPESALEQLVASERAFAKMSVERGVRESFSAFFAPDGVNFQPHPVNFHEEIKRQPAPTTAPQSVLNWTPIYGDISRAGDLGYDTGPYTLEDLSPLQSPTRHGLFFSVWKRQEGGDFKVVLDVGVTTPTAVVPLDSPFQAAPGLSSSVAETSAGPDGLLQAEREFFARAAGSGASSAFRERISDHARIHRPDAMPLVGKDEISSWIDGLSATLSGEPMKAVVADSGDLGYTYGSYRFTGSIEEQGYYARVWKRDGQGGWRIVLDVTNPLPAAQ